MAAVTMKAVGVEEYGDVEALIEREVEVPKVRGHEILVEVKATSINPIDTKIRAGRYDDQPDYYSRAPRPFQILGFDGAGVVVERGERCRQIQAGNHVFYACSPLAQGANATYQALDERTCARMPRSLGFAKAAALPLAYLTAYEALVERLAIRPGERAAILVINGAGGVGSMAVQLARAYLGLPAVVATASRSATRAFVQEMGATHVVSHCGGSDGDGDDDDGGGGGSGSGGSLEQQVAALRLDVPLRYILIASHTDSYMRASAALCAPFGKVCSIVQGRAEMLGTEFMAKSLSFVWCYAGTRAFYGGNVESHGCVLAELAELVDRGIIKSNATETLPFTLEGLKMAHSTSETGKMIGKMALTKIDDELVHYDRKGSVG